MRRVVISGMGIVSCLGNNKKEVLDSLIHTKSGIVFSEEYKNYNFKSQVCGEVKNLNLDDYIDRKNNHIATKSLLTVAMVNSLVQEMLNYLFRQC